MPYHVTPCHIMSHHALSCHTMPYHVISCHVMIFHTMPYHLTPCHVIYDMAWCHKVDLGARGCSSLQTCQNRTNMSGGCIYPTLFLMSSPLLPLVCFSGPRSSAVSFIVAYCLSIKHMLEKSHNHLICYTCLVAYRKCSRVLYNVHVISVKKRTKIQELF